MANRDWRASLFDRLNPSFGVLNPEIDEAQKSKLGRESLLNAGLAMLQSRGGFGNMLQAGIQGGLLGAREGGNELINNRYRQAMMQRTMAGMDRNTKIEELSRRAIQGGQLDP